jgi:hypothetical protein
VGPAERRRSRSSSKLVNCRGSDPTYSSFSSSLRNSTETGAASNRERTPRPFPSIGAGQRTGANSQGPLKRFRRGYRDRRQTAQAAHALGFQGRDRGRRSRPRARPDPVEFSDWLSSAEQRQSRTARLSLRITSFPRNPRHGPRWVPVEMKLLWERLESSKESCRRVPVLLRGTARSQLVFWSEGEQRGDRSWLQSKATEENLPRNRLGVSAG